MSHIILHPTCFELECAAYICSLQFELRRVPYGFSGGFAAMLMSEIKEDSMTDHIEMVIEPRYVRQAQAIFEARTPELQILDIFGDHKVVNVYKEDPKGAVIVKFVTAGQEHYPSQLFENIPPGAGPT